MTSETLLKHDILPHLTDVAHPLKKWAFILYCSDFILPLSSDKTQKLYCMIKRLLSLFTMLAMMAALPASAQTASGTFEAGEGSFLLNGKPFVVKAAEIHYPRIPQAYWEHRIQMCKALGMNTVCIYIFWNIHEQKEGQFDWTGNNDVAAFCRLAQKNGMYVIVRPGPYVCAEWEMGGLPWWLLKKKDIRLREQDPYFMERVKIF